MHDMSHPPLPLSFGLSSYRSIFLYHRRDAPARMKAKTERDGEHAVSDPFIIKLIKTPLIGRRLSVHQLVRREAKSAH